jgi:hypothetical protein
MSGPVTVSRVVPWPFEAEDRVVALWREAERVRHLSPHQLRANLRGLLEARDFIEAALDAAIPDRENCDG